MDITTFLLPVEFFKKVFGIIAGMSVDEQTSNKVGLRQKCLIYKLTKCLTSDMI